MLFSLLYWQQFLHINLKPENESSYFSKYISTLVSGVGGPSLASLPGFLRDPESQYQLEAAEEFSLVSCLLFYLLVCIGDGACLLAAVW